MKTRVKTDPGESPSKSYRHVSIPLEMVEDRYLTFQDLGFIATVLPLCSATLVCTLGMRGLAEALGVHERIIRKEVNYLEQIGWCESWRERVASERGQPRRVFRIFKSKEEKTGA